MSPELARIAELENALQNAVAYLRALPAHPETYRQANDAEATLNRGMRPSVLEGGKIGPAGNVVIAARLSGPDLTLRTAPLPAKLEQEGMRSLYAGLAQGVTLRLEDKPFSKDIFD